MTRGLEFLSRRAWLLSLGGLSVLRGAEQNLASPLAAISGTITPANLFFVRDHFAEPDLSLPAWTLRIEGTVARPFEMSFSDLLESPTSKMEAVLECAGNPASGFAVSNGIWEGVSLPHLLERAKPRPEAAYALLEGADAGSLGRSSRVLPYSRIVPLRKCLDPKSLVAFKLNDRFLPRRNGFPARALLPGWYAMDSVKWLRRIQLLSEEAEATGFYESGMDQYYVRLLRSAGGQRRGGRVSEILVKSVIAYPSDGAKLPAGTHSVWGFAWTGARAIKKVELSGDGGRTWSEAKLDSPPRPLAWVRWSCRWKAAPGEHALMSRALDDAGQEQPLERDPSREDGYELNACAPVRCSVR